MIKPSKPKVTKLIWKSGKIFVKPWEWRRGCAIISGLNASPLPKWVLSEHLVMPRISTQTKAQNTEHRTQTLAQNCNIFLPMYNSVPPLPTTVIYTENYDRKAKQKQDCCDKMQFPPHVASTVSLQIWKQINHVKQSGASNSVDSFWQDTQQL